MPTALGGHGTRKRAPLRRLRVAANLDGEMT